MFELRQSAVRGPGFDDGFNVHEARAGLRYQFGSNGCVPAAGPLRAARAVSTNKPSRSGPTCDRPAYRRAVFVWAADRFPASHKKPVTSRYP